MPSSCARARTVPFCHGHSSSEEECRRLSCLLSPPSTLDTDTLNTYCSMEDADDSFYSIKDIKQINDEEFEAVFEFDSNEGEAIGLR